MFRLWCFPQWILGIIVRLCLRAKYERHYRGRKVYRFPRGKWFSGTALYHTLLPHDAGIRTIGHEHGHHIQGNWWGPLYLIVVGILSLRHNLRARRCQRTWENYYKLFPEEQADRLGLITWVNGVRVYGGQG